MSVAALSITGNAQRGLLLEVAPGDDIGTGRLSHTGEFHDLIILELESIDEKNHLGWIGIDQNDIGIKGIVDERSQGHGLILTDREAEDRTFILPAILLGFCPDDRSKGAILTDLRDFSQPDDGRTLRKKEVIEIGSNGPIEIPDKGDELAEGYLMGRSSEKGNCRKGFLLF
jgi:hypothetical protein